MNWNKAAMFYWLLQDGVDAVLVRWTSVYIGSVSGSVRLYTRGMSTNQPHKIMFIPTNHNKQKLLFSPTHQKVIPVDSNKEIIMVRSHWPKRCRHWELYRGYSGYWWGMESVATFLLVSMSVSVSVCVPSLAGCFSAQTRCLRICWMRWLLLYVQVYPTTTRALGLGSCSGMARIGALVTPFVAQVRTLKILPSMSKSVSISQVCICGKKFALRPLKQE